jgi:hypothetical protein
MTSWIRKALLGVAAVIVLMSSGSAQTPDGTMVYTRIANWQIARPNWEAYTDDLKKNTVPVLEKLLADGVITEYGLVSAAIHTPDGYTHSTWYSSRTIAGLEKALAAILAADKKLPAAERHRGDTDFAGTKHSDLLVRSRILHPQTSKLTSGYMTVGADQIQPGKVQAYNERFEKVLRPIIEPLAASGAVTSFGIDNEFIHTGDQLMRSRWYLVPSAEGLDKVAAAITAFVDGQSPADREAFEKASQEILVGSAHRDELWEIVAYASKY